MPGPAKTVSIKLVADSAEAQRKLDDIYRKAEELGRLNPEIKPKIDKAAATAGLAVLRKELKDTQSEADKLSGSAGKLATSAESLGTSATSAGAGLGAMGSPMGGLIGAGVALSPIIATLGVGLAGFGAAAIGVLKPIENAASKTGGLSKNMKLLNPEQQAVARSLMGLGHQYDQFQHSLQPEVLATFGTGLHLVSGLMRDVQPVAKATGNALNGVLASIDTEFRGAEWKQFFGWMAAQAGPDLQLLGQGFTNILHTLPPLLESLQPVARTTLQLAVDITILANKAEQLRLEYERLRHSGNDAGLSLGGVAHAAGQAAAQFVPGVKYAGELRGWFDKMGGSATHAAAGTQALTVQQSGAAKATAAQTAAVNKLNAAMTANIAKVLTLEGDEVSWKQAQQAATQAVNANHKALDGNSAAALAARAAIISATQSVIKFADDSNVSTSALHRGSDALANQITWLEKHAGKSRIAAEEIKALREEEAKIKREIDQRIQVTGSGRFSVSGAGLPGGIGHHVGGGAAAGMLVRGGIPGRDSVLVSTMPGELIVPTPLVQAGAVDHLRGRIPGFAGGGIVPSYGGGVPGLGPWAVGNTQAALHGFDQSIASALARQLRSMSAGIGLGGVSNLSAVAALQSAAAKMGWFGAQWQALSNVEMREAGFNIHAVNPGSGAYGLAQFINGPAEYYQYGGNPDTAAGQAVGMVNYIAQRYGTPGAAWAHELSAGWYDHGGFLPPGPSIAFNGTGKPEPVGAAAAGGNHYTINVNVPVAANKREIGRQVVEAIREFEKGSGTSWRK